MGNHEITDYFYVKFVIWVPVGYECDNYKRSQYNLDYSVLLSEFALETLNFDY